MRRVWASLTLTVAVTANVIPHNRQPDLLPPSGGWRGSTLGSASLIGDGGPEKYEQVYGHELHLWRTFREPNLSGRDANITDAERAFVEAGGILWYNMDPRNWSAAARPAYEPTIRAYAAAVKSLSPAQVIVVPGHEPDGHCDPAHMDHEPHEYFGSPAEYRAMWSQFRAIFAATGVDNAIWAMDFSRGLFKPAVFDHWVAALWPGDLVVDWLFFNAFGDHPMADKEGRGNWSKLVGSIYSQFESKSGAGHNYSRVPWGVGAFQPKAAPHMDNADRQEFILQAGEALNTSHFPRLRGMVYYDHDAKEMPDTYQPAYERYLSSPFFTANDATLSRRAVDESRVTG